MCFDERGWLATNVEGAIAIREAGSLSNLLLFLIFGCFLSCSLVIYTISALEGSSLTTRPSSIGFSEQWSSCSPDSLLSSCSFSITTSLFGLRPRRTLSGPGSESLGNFNYSEDSAGFNLSSFLRLSTRLTSRFLRRMVDAARTSSSDSS